MTLEQMRAVHRTPSTPPVETPLGPVLASRVLPPWLEDTMQYLTHDKDIEDTFEDLDDELEAGFQDSVELLHQAMDLLGKYGQKRHAVTLDVRKEFVEMAQKIFETLDQYHLLEETHR